MHEYLEEIHSLLDDFETELSKVRTIWRQIEDAAAVLLSLVQTCRALSLNPREYLEDVMRKLMSHNSQKLYELLPDHWAKARQS